MENDTTLWRIQKLVDEWVQIKSRTVKTAHLDRYRTPIVKGLMAIVTAKREGKRRADGTPLQWKPGKIGPDEVRIFLEDCTYTTYNIGRMKDFLEYHNNTVFRRVVYETRKPKKRGYTWYRLNEMEIIFEEARQCGPVIAFITHAIYLGMRPIAIFGLRVQDIDRRARIFHVRDKGRDPRDKELGKPRIIVFDPETDEYLDRVMEYRDGIYDALERKLGRQVPREPRLLIYRKGRKVHPYGPTPRIGANNLFEYTRPLAAALEARGVKFMAYNIRKTLEDEMEIMLQLDGEDQFSAEDIQAFFDWESTATRKNYSSRRSLLFRKYRIKERQLRNRQKIEPILKEMKL